MKQLRQYGNAIIFTALTCFLLAACSSIKTSSTGQHVSLLNSADFQQTASTLKDFQSKEYFMISPTKVENFESFEGSIIRRSLWNTSYMGSGQFAHADGSITKLITLDGESTMRLTMDFTLSGHAIMAIDQDDDDIIELIAVKHSNTSGFYGAVTPALEDAIDCFEIAERNASFSTLFDCIEPEQSNTNPRSVGPILDQFVDDFLFLDCSGETNNIGGLVSEGDGSADDVDALWEERHSRSREDARRHEREAERLLESDSSEDQRLAKMHQEAAQQAADAAEEMIGVEPGTEEYLTGHENWADKQSRYDTTDDLIRRRGGRGNDSPVPDPTRGPTADVLNPRCNKRTDLSSCGSDLLSCVLKPTDPLSNFTEGNCRKEVGPNDAPTIICESNKESPPDGEVGPGGPGARPVDAPTNFPTGPKISTRFIDLAPIGGIILGACVRGGCPDF